MTAPHIVAVARSGSHTFSKPTSGGIRLLAGLGVEGDAHLGRTVKHRSRVRVDPTRPNLRQVHLIHAELLDELVDRGFAIGPGDLGENVTTRGIALLDLPTGTRLALGRAAVVEITGLRNPCGQIEAFRPGLLGVVLTKGADGRIARKTGVMGIVLTGGEVFPGDPIGVELPAGAHRTLEVV